MKVTIIEKMLWLVVILVFILVAVTFIKGGR